MHYARLGLGLLIIGLCPTMAFGQSLVPPPPESRMHDFVQASILSPGPYVLDLGAAAIDELSNFPEEWQGREGFGNRMLARVGMGFASDVIGHGVGAVLRHRVLYEPCGCNGGWRRTKHALGRGFVTRHDEGRLVPHVPLLVAKFGAAGVANAWYPGSYTGRDIVREGFAGIGANALLNIAREFGPELMRMVGLR